MKAREAYRGEGIEVDYVDVLSGSDKMEAMLKHSRGARKVPVIVAEDGITIGYRGGS